MPWQFSRDNTVITHDYVKPELVSDSAVLFDTDGCVIIAAAKDDRGWYVSASDYYHQWTDYTGNRYMDYTSAVYDMFKNIDHEPETHDASETRRRDGMEYVLCDVCGEECDSLDI